MSKHKQKSGLLKTTFRSDPPAEPYVRERLDALTILLDPQNPRFAPDEKGKSQHFIYELMIERFAIQEVAESICTAGFLPMDPFIAYRENNKVVMLEGNRRLATIQLLLDAERVPERYRTRWAELRTRLPASSRTEMNQLTVLIYPSRDMPELLAYIGFRHVNGVKNWDSEEKAAYIARLIETQKWTYDDIAKKLGSKPSIVEKLYVAHRIIEQAKDDGIGYKPMRKQFGVLTRAVQSPGVVKFLGVTFPRDPAKSRKPVTSTPKDLEDFARWTFGDSEVRPVLEDSRDLTKWGHILSSAESVRYLRTAKDPRFDRAYSKSGGLKAGLIDSLLSASDNLEEAVPLVRQHRAEADVRSAVDRCADYTVQILTHFPDIAQKQGLEIKNVAGTA